MPSIANSTPKTLPKRPVNSGHSSPNSKDSTVPVTAPTANVTATTFDQRRASSSASASSLRSPRYSAMSMIAGNATPTDARMMWKPSVNAIWLRAHSRLDIARVKASVIGGSCLAPVMDLRQRTFGAAGTEEAERPADQRLEAVLEPGEECGVDEQPHHPRGEAGDADAVEAHDRATPRYRGHASEVAVLEGL